MAANISIDAEKAEIWVKDVEAEIEEVNGVLNRVTGVLTTVAGDDDMFVKVAVGGGRVAGRPVESFRVQ